MTLSKQRLDDFIAPPILQHLADTFSARYELAMIFFDHQGRSLTIPKLSFLPAVTDNTLLQEQIKTILITPPDAERLNLRDGKTVYAGYFNGALQRVVLPVLFQQQLFGVCQILCWKPNAAEEMKKWEFVLNGFSHSSPGPLSYMDDQPLPPTEEMILIAIDLTSQWQRLLEAGRQQWLAQPIDSTAETEAITETDRNLQGNLIVMRSFDIIEADLPAVLLLGYDSAEEMIGLNLLTHLIQRPSQSAELVEFIENRTPVIQYEVDLFCKNGSPVSVLLSVHPQISFQGEPVGYHLEIAEKGEPKPAVASTLPDETAAQSDESKEEPADPIPWDLRSQLRDLRAKLSRRPEEGKRLLAQTQGSAFVLDPADQVVVWSEAMQEMLQIPAATILGNNFDQLLLRDSQQAFHAALQAFRSDPGLREQAIPDLFSLVDNNGDPVQVRVTLSKNELVDLEVVTVSLTEQRVTAGPLSGVPCAGKSLYELQEYFAKGLASASIYTGGNHLARLQESAAIITSNLDQSLSAVFSRNGWMSMLHPGDKGVDNDLWRTQQEIERTFMLIRRLQYFSQSVSLHRRPVSLAAIIRQASSLQGGLFNRPLDVRFDLHPQVDSVLADVSLLQQAIDFICQNSVEALQHSGDTLLVRTQPLTPASSPSTEPEILIEIMDNGPGIDEGILAKLFEPFTTTKPNGHGHGLGLPAAYGIIRSHQGHVLVRSKKNVGTSVQIFLPAPLAASAPISGPTPLSGNASFFAFRRSQRILIVDDDPDLVPLMKRALEKEAYEISVTDSGENAIELFARNPHHFDGLIIDVSLYGMSGIDCAKEILQIRRIPILLSSGFPAVPSAMELVQACGGAYLQKPYGMSYLVQVVRQVI